VIDAHHHPPPAARSYSASGRNSSAAIGAVGSVPPAGRPRARPTRERRIRFRIGINLGDVIAKEEDIFEDGLNVAARLARISHSAADFRQSAREAADKHMKKVLVVG
jgi:class 3 adenylate cyclase